MTPSTTRWMFVLACIIFLLQATPLLYTRWVEDENWYSSVGYTLLTEGHLRNPVFPDTDLESHVDTRPPGLPIALAAAADAFGPGPSQFRIPSIVASLGLLLAVFLLGTELMGPGAGAVAILLAATDTFLILASRTARQEAYVACFATFAVWLYYRGRRTNSALLSLLSGLAAGLALNFHPNALAIAGSLGLLLLIEFRLGIIRAPRFWAFAAGLVAAMLPFAIWIVTSPERIEAFRHLWGRSSELTASVAIGFEKARYSDFLGVGSTRVPLPIHVPVRAHIVAAIAIAAALLWRSRRKLLVEMLVLMIPSMLLWTTEVNGTARFFAILEPYIVMILVAGAIEFGNTPARLRLAMAALCFVALTQVAGNAYFIWKSRSADYRAVAAGLRAAVPPAAKVYGALTFWLAFYDRPYYSYNRTTLDYALQHGVDYLILNDRVMQNGTGYYGYNIFSSARDQITEFAHSHCRLVGKVPNSFYGDLEVYRVVH